MFNRIPLDNKSFTVELTPELTVPIGTGAFKILSHLDIESVLLQLPMPTPAAKLNRRSSANYSSSAHETTKPMTYSIGAQTFEVKLRHLDRAYQFNIIFTKENKITEQEFDEQYTNNFVDRYKANCSEFEFTSELYTYNQQIDANQIGREVDIELMLKNCLYLPIEAPLKHTLKLRKREMMTQMEYFHKLKGSKISGDSSDPNHWSQIRTLIVGKGSSLRFLGLLSCPDFILGYFYDFLKKGELAVFATVIGEVKLPAMELANCCNILRDCTWYRDRFGSNHIISQPPLGGSNRHLVASEIEDMTRLKASVRGGFKVKVDTDLGFVWTNARTITEFQKTIQKLVTLGCHAGVNKLMLTTYTDTLLIKLEPELLGRSKLDTHTRPLRNSGPATIMKSSHYVVKSDDSNARIKIAAFMDIEANQLKNFQLLIGNFLKEEYSKLSLESHSARAESRASTHSSSTMDHLSSAFKRHRISDSEKQAGQATNTNENEPPSNEGGTGSGRNQQHNFAGSIFKTRSLVSLRPRTVNDSTRRLKLDGDILDGECELELGSMTKQFLQWGPYLSQVLVVNMQLFISNIAANHLFRMPRHNEEDVVVKVYDPLWATSIDREATDEEYADLYQESVDLCVVEIQAYSKLEKLAGTVIPRCFGYGTILDSTIGAGKPHIRAEGPAIFLENLENIRDSKFQQKDITPRIVKRILRAYSNLHALKVVHGDVSFKNILMTKDGTVKILDFSHAKINATRQDIAEELRLVHSHFDIK